MQFAEPPLLLQVALLSQPPLFVAHGLMGVKVRRNSVPPPCAPPYHVVPYASPPLPPTSQAEG